MGVGAAPGYAVPKLHAAASARGLILAPERAGMDEKGHAAWVLRGRF